MAMLSYTWGYAQGPVILLPQLSNGAEHKGEEIGRLRQQTEAPGSAAAEENWIVKFF